MNPIPTNSAAEPIQQSGREIRSIMLQLQCICECTSLDVESKQNFIMNARERYVETNKQFGVFFGINHWFLCLVFFFLSVLFSHLINVLRKRDYWDRHQLQLYVHQIILRSRSTISMRSEGKHAQCSVRDQMSYRLPVDREILKNATNVMNVIFVDIKVVKKEICENTCAFIQAKNRSLVSNVRSLLEKKAICIVTCARNHAWKIWKI